MGFLRVSMLFLLISLGFCEEQLNPHLLPRPLILEYNEKIDPKSTQYGDEVEMQCTSWRFGVEANNVSPWKTIPSECADYVKDYLTGRRYRLDLERASNEAAVYARGLQLSGDGKDVWVFDVDETLLSNLPYYAQHGYGSAVFDAVEFDKWVDKAAAPALEPSLKLYEQIIEMGIKVFLLTGRIEQQRNLTVQNLINVGFSNWDKLILRSSDDQGKEAIVYKSEKRSEMASEGYRIVGNSGDQWSDLLGSSMSIRSFKLPNPMYYIL